MENRPFSSMVYRTSTWWFSMAMLVITRGYMPVNKIQGEVRALHQCLISRSCRAMGVPQARWLVNMSWIWNRQHGWWNGGSPMPQESFEFRHYVDPTIATSLRWGQVATNWPFPSPSKSSKHQLWGQHEPILTRVAAIFSMGPWVCSDFFWSRKHHQTAQQE